MHSDYIPFAERSDFKLGSGRILDDSLQRGGRSRRRIFLLRMMAFEDLSEILVPQSGRCASRNLKKQIYTQREIGRLEQTDSASRVFHHEPDSRQLAVPAGSSNDNAFLRSDASFNVPEHRGWGGEIDDHVDRSQLLRSERGSSRILSRAQHLHLVAALARHFRDQRTRLSPA